MPLHSHAFLGWTKAIPVFLNWESKSLFFLWGAEQSKNEPKKMIVLECLFLTIAPCDAAEPWQLGSQDAATPMMQGIIDLHHDIFFFLILIFVFVSWILVRALWHFHYKKNPIPQRIVHGTTIEILWTIFPSIILMFIAIPSFALLYSMDEVVVDPAITIKAIGHQWYWTYEYSDYNSGDEQSLTFDSYTIPEDDPELGVKCDAVPGRLNQTSISKLFLGKIMVLGSLAIAIQKFRFSSTSSQSLIATGGNALTPTTPTMEFNNLIEESSSSSSSDDSLTTFRNIIAAPNERELYNRITFLENQNYYGLPPQTRPGEYSSIVREHFDQSIHVRHYRRIYDQELFELQILEIKGALQDKLNAMMLEEPNLARIIQLSPYDNIREQAFSFIEGSTESISAMRHSFQRDLMSGALNHFLQDISRRGRHSEIYQDFYRYFTDEAFSISRSFDGHKEIVLVATTKKRLAPQLVYKQDDQSESAGEKKRESAKNLSDSVTEQSDDSSVTQDDPTPSTLLSLYTTSEVEERKNFYLYIVGPQNAKSSPLEAILNAARAPGDRGLLEQMIVDLTQRSILNIEICFIPVYSKNNVSQLAKIKRTHSTVLDQRLNINIPIKDQARRMFAYLALLSCSLLLTYETSLAARFLPFKPAKVGDEKGKEKGPSLVQSFPIDDLSRCISEA
ncbi:UNVERIFIED_CONTAM: Cytochrome c oxidase subunit [Sesamum calycinum]|uniref:Cytochrome c oxidase subunit 2 n=1 Tax=Sesamum calycinum TaxID=2727403 RepID=A0AAW2IU20_9LAMI